MESLENHTQVCGEEAGSMGLKRVTFECFSKEKTPGSLSEGNKETGNWELVRVAAEVEVVMRKKCSSKK